MMKKFEHETKIYHYEVQEEDVASFKGNLVHQVCSTFALAREIEWATRQHILRVLEHDEEGIGTALSINHVAPAKVGDILTITSSVQSSQMGNLICSYQVMVGSRLVANGTTGQKILKKDKLEKIFNSI